MLVYVKRAGAGDLERCLRDGSYVFAAELGETALG